MPWLDRFTPRRSGHRRAVVERRGGGRFTNSTSVTMTSLPGARGGRDAAGDWWRIRTLLRDALRGRADRWGVMVACREADAEGSDSLVVGAGGRLPVAAGRKDGDGLGRGSRVPPRVKPRRWWPGNEP